MCNGVGCAFPLGVRVGWSVVALLLGCGGYCSGVIRSYFVRLLLSVVWCAVFLSAVVCMGSKGIGEGEGVVNDLLKLVRSIVCVIKLLSSLWVILPDTYKLNIFIMKKLSFLLFLSAIIGAFIYLLSEFTYFLYYVLRN